MPTFHNNDETNLIDAFNTSESDQEIEKSQECCYVQEPREDKVTDKAYDIIKAGQKDSLFIMDLQSIRDRVN